MTASLPFAIVKITLSLVLGTGCAYRHKSM
jgi:hypothetical protein